MIPPPPLLKQGLEKMPKESCSEQIKWRKVWKNEIEKKGECLSSEFF